MAQKNKVQDGKVVYASSDSKEALDFNVVGQVSITPPDNDLYMGNSDITTTYGGSLSITTDTGGDINITPGIGGILYINGTPYIPSAGGTVTSVSAEGAAGEITVLDSTITEAGTMQFSLASTGAIAGSYTNANITIDSKGRIISAESSTSGISGYSGISGFSGFSGFSGISGETGSAGASGFSGFSGISGETGSAGASGFSGATGKDGNIGLSSVVDFLSIQVFQ